MSKHASKDEKQFAMPFVFNGMMTSAYGNAGMAWLKACQEWQHEIARFAGSRMQGDMDLMKSLAECHSAADMAKLQREWAMTAFRDYAGETGELMQIAGRAAQDGVPAAPPKTEAP